MSNLLWLTDEQMARLSLYFPRVMASHAWMKGTWCGGYLLQSQRQEMVGRSARHIHFTTAVSVESKWQTPLVRAPLKTGCVCPDHGRADRRAFRSQGYHDRCNLSEGTSHGFKPAAGIPTGRCHPDGGKGCTPDQFPPIGKERYSERRQYGLQTRHLECKPRVRNRPPIAKWTCLYSQRQSTRVFT